MFDITRYKKNEQRRRKYRYDDEYREQKQEYARAYYYSHREQILKRIKEKKANG